MNDFNPIPRVGLGILVFNDKNEILLGRRIGGAHGKSTWSPPSGHLEFGESFEDCAIREILEETGLVVKDPEFLAVTNDFFQQEQKHYISIFMKVKYPQEQQVKNCEPHKTEEWQWFDINKLPSDLFLPLHNLINDKGHGKLL